MRHCLGISGFIMPVSNSDNFFKGYTIKPVHGGQAAQVALQSAYLARAGFEAGPLEGEPPRHHAVLRTLSDGNPDLSRCTDDLGAVWHSMEVAFKPYPVGLLNVGAIQLCLSLRREAGFDFPEIERVEVSTYKEAAIFTGQKYTTAESSFIDCHLSLPFCVAISLIDGELTPRQLLRSRTRDPTIHDLASRVHVREDQAMSQRYPHVWPVEVAIRLRDGRVLRAAVEEVGWSPRRPPSWDHVAEKFVIMSEPVIGGSAAHQVTDLIGKLEQIDDIRVITAVLGPRSPASATLNPAVP
jgi:2-methylcitrate dehydratase PrpD